MSIVSATELKAKTGQVIDQARKEPVYVQSHGRNAVVILDVEEYEHLRRMEDAYWLERARDAEKTGFLGTEETTRWLQERLKALEE